MVEKKQETEGDEKKKKANKRLALHMEVGVTIHSDVAKFHLWDEEKKEDLYEELSVVVKKAKKELHQILSTRVDLWQETGSHTTTWREISETGRPDKQGQAGEA